MHISIFLSGCTEQVMTGVEHCATCGDSNGNSTECKSCDSGFVLKDGKTLDTACVGEYSL